MLSHKTSLKKLKIIKHICTKYQSAKIHKVNTDRIEERNQQLRINTKRLQYLTVKKQIYQQMEDT